MGLRICYVTCAENGLYGLRRLAAAGHEIACVVSISPRLGQRYHVSGYVDVSPWCRSADISLILLDSYALSPADLAEYHYDVILVNGWNRLIPAEVIATAPFGGLGIHAGHPPIGLGRAPLVWNILLGRRDLEVYVFRLTPCADDGPILASRPVEITDQDDVWRLYQKVMFCGVDLFSEALLALERCDSGRNQLTAEAKYYQKRGPDDGLIDFSQSESQVFNFIRAQTKPYPGAFTYLNGTRWNIWQAVPFDAFAFRDRLRVPGEVVAALPDGLVVQTGGSTLWLLKADADGECAIPAPLYRLERLVGERFLNKPDGSSGQISAN